MITGGRAEHSIMIREQNRASSQGLNRTRAEQSRAEQSRNLAMAAAYILFLSNTLLEWGEQSSTEQNRTEQSRTEQNRTEQNRTEHAGI